VTEEENAQNLDNYDPAVRKFALEVRFLVFVVFSCSPFLPSLSLNSRLQVRKRGTKILLMPPGMSKRKENESFYDTKKSLIFWKIFFLFLQTPIFSVNEVISFSSNGNSKDGNFYGFNIIKINENASLKDVLQHYIESEEVRKTLCCPS
jgi:hypothetical protein